MHPVSLAEIIPLKVQLSLVLLLEGDIFPNCHTVVLGRLVSDSTEMGLCSPLCKWCALNAGRLKSLLELSKFIQQLSCFFSLRYHFPGLFLQISVTSPSCKAKERERERKKEEKKMHTHLHMHVFFGLQFLNSNSPCADSLLYGSSSLHAVLMLNCISVASPEVSVVLHQESVLPRALSYPE